MKHFAEDYFFYLLFAGLCQLIFFVVPSALVGSFFASRFGKLRWAAHGRDLLLFNIALLLLGGFGNALWHQLTFGKLYLSVDRLADFLPFWPFGQWVLNQNLGAEHGRLLNGATLTQLRLIWLLIAAPVWFGAISFVVAWHRRTPARLPLSPAPSS